METPIGFVVLLFQGVVYFPGVNIAVSFREGVFVYPPKS